MPSRRAKIAVFAGTFDPPTNGHLDIIRRARLLFDKLVVAVGRNPEKQALFSEADRVAMLRKLTAQMSNVQVRSYPGLTMDFVRQLGATVIIKGIRDSSDLGSELQQASLNQLAGNVETVFLLTSDQHALTSSTLIRQVAEIGSSDIDHLTRLVPQDVARRLKVRFRRPINGATAAGRRRLRTSRARRAGRR